jgi:CopG family transcriptional regulator, nickel-responsive regulator
MDRLCTLKTRMSMPDFQYSQHVHLDHDNCLEIVAVPGRPKDVETLLAHLKAVKGLKHVSLAAGTTGRRL